MADILGIIANADIITIAVLCTIVLLLVGILGFVPIGLWHSARAAGFEVSLGNLIGMRLRRVQPDRIVKPFIRGTKEGLDLDMNQLESHYLSRGRVDHVVNALIAAKKKNVSLSFEKAAVLDLDGRDVVEAVKMSVLKGIPLEEYEAPSTFYAHTPK